MNAEKDIKVSVVIPLYNEERSVGPLYSALKASMDGLGEPYEIIFINDGSTDATPSELDRIGRDDGRVSIIVLEARSGQTEALRRGFREAKGDVIVSMDGDLQNDAADIPKLITELKKGYDFVCGWRHKRIDPVSKKVASGFGNFVQRNIFKSHLHDISCTLRAYTKEAIGELPLKRKGAHRFIPYLLMMKGKRASEVRVDHHSRPFGKTKYGFFRSFRVARDFLTLIFNRNSWF